MYVYSIFFIKKIVYLHENYHSNIFCFLFEFNGCFFFFFVNNISHPRASISTTNNNSRSQTCDSGAPMSESEIFLRISEMKVYPKPIKER